MEGGKAETSVVNNDHLLTINNTIPTEVAKDHLLGDVVFDQAKKELLVITPNGESVIPLDDTTYSFGGVYKDGAMLHMDADGNLGWNHQPTPPTV